MEKVLYRRRGRIAHITSYPAQKAALAKTVSSRDAATEPAGMHLRRVLASTFVSRTSSAPQLEHLHILHILLRRQRMTQ